MAHSLTTLCGQWFNRVQVNAFNSCHSRIWLYTSAIFIQEMSRLVLIVSMKCMKSTGLTHFTQMYWKLTIYERIISILTCISPQLIYHLYTLSNKRGPNMDPCGTPLLFLASGSPYSIWLYHQGQGVCSCTVPWVNTVAKSCFSTLALNKKLTKTRGIGQRLCPSFNILGPC